MNAQQLRQIIRDRQQELIDLASSFIQIPSVNSLPDFPETTSQISRLIGSYLENKGLHITEHNNPESGLLTVIGHAPLNGMPGERLLFSGHTDVVPAGDLSRWSFDPFSGEVRDGMLLGRGTSDMKAGLAAAVFVAVLLQEYAPELELSGSLGVVLSPDEESGGQEVSSLLEAGYIEGDACLIAEPTHPLHPNIGEKAKAWLKISIPGEPGHGSHYPFVGESAVRKGALIVKELQRLLEMQAMPPAELYALSSRTAWFFGEQQGNELLSHLLYRPSYNPGVFQGGTIINVVAENSELEIDIRVPFGMRSDYVLAAVKELVYRVDAEAVVEPIIIHSNPNWTREDRPIVRMTEYAIQQVHGTEEPVFGVLLIGSSDASHFRRHGIDTVLYGPGMHHTIHGYDEHVPVESIVETAEVYAEAAVGYLTDR